MWEQGGALIQLINNTMNSNNSISSNWTSMLEEASASIKTEGDSTGMREIINGLEGEKVSLGVLGLIRSALQRRFDFRVKSEVHRAVIQLDAQIENLIEEKRSQMFLARDARKKQMRPATPKPKSKKEKSKPRPRLDRRIARRSTLKKVDQARILRVNGTGKIDIALGFREEGKKKVLQVVDVKNVPELVRGATFPVDAQQSWPEVLREAFAA